MRDLSSNHDCMALNGATVRRQWRLDRILDECARRGIRAVSPWREQVAEIGIAKVAAQLRALDMRLSGYCRVGFFTGVDAAARRAAQEENFRAIDEAKTLGAPCAIVVVGALPGGMEGHALYKDIVRARAEVEDGLGETLDYAKSVGMPLAIEPLHPMQAAERACVNTLEHALDLCDQFDHERSGALGVAVDVYHTWWDPKLKRQIERAGAKRIFAFHVCDWLTPTTHLVNDRGMMGDGVIEIPRIRKWVEGAGYAGPIEVEIFSETWWARPGELVLDTCVERFRSAV